MGRLTGMSAGAVIELDREADDPIDVYVNGVASRPAGSSSPTRPNGPCGSTRAAGGHGPDSIERTVVTMARVLVVDDALFMRKMVSPTSSRRAATR